MRKARHPFAGAVVYLLCAALALPACCAGPILPAQTPRNVGDGTWQAVREFPHDRQAFTQGLVFADGALYEGTGLYGKSSLRRVDLATGDVKQQTSLENRYFGEGIAIAGSQIYQLTWTSKTGFIYDRDSFAPLGEFTYPGEGWGLTHDGAALILSDGSNKLYFYTPNPFTLARTVEVTENGAPVAKLNELEYIQGAIWANVWMTDSIVRIDPQNGHVLERINLGGLLPPLDRIGADVLNGIAYDSAGDHIYVTGKLWPKLFEIRRTPSATK